MSSLFVLVCPKPLSEIERLSGPERGLIGTYKRLALRVALDYPRHAALHNPIVRVLPDILSSLFFY
jgi:hypothetical protein